jgi:hypothetical protein
MPEATQALRISCSVLHCRRTTKPETLATGEPAFLAQEWLCAKHWPLVRKDLKHQHREAKRSFRTNPNHETHALELSAWAACVSNANDAASGH